MTTNCWRNPPSRCRRLGLSPERAAVHPERRPHALLEDVHWRRWCRRCGPCHGWSGCLLERGDPQDDRLQECPQWQASCGACPQGRAPSACRPASSSVAHVRGLHRRGDSQRHPLQSTVRVGVGCGCTEPGCRWRMSEGGTDELSRSRHESFPR